MSDAINRADELFQTNWRLPDFLATRVFRELRQAGEEPVMRDLQQAAVDGLQTAARLYMETQSNRAFGSFAHAIIMGSILETLSVKQQQALPWYVRRHIGLVA